MPKEDINQQLLADLELAINLLQSYQRALYTLNAPDPNVAQAYPLMRRYKVEPYKQSDGYRILLETPDGTYVEISDPEKIEEVDLDLRIETDYATGKSKVVHKSMSPSGPIKDGDCPDHSVPLAADEGCHRCEYFYGDRWGYRDR